MGHESYTSDSYTNSYFILVPEEINCYVNNGWCSHGCNDSADEHVCECPTCWTLGDDGRTCSPEADKLTTTCNADSMVRNSKLYLSISDGTNSR